MGANTFLLKEKKEKKEKFIKKRYLIWNQYIDVRFSHSVIYVFSTLYGTSIGMLRVIFVKCGVNPNQKFYYVPNDKIKCVLDLFHTYCFDNEKILVNHNKKLLRFQLFDNYKGFRQLHGLPVNGQRTCSNAKTCRSKLFHNRLLNIIKKIK